MNMMMNMTMMMKCVALVLALLVSFAARADEPTAQAVLEAADRILAPARYSADIKMVAKRPDGTAREYAYRVSKSDDDKLLLTFTAPSTLSGHSALRRGSELWRYVPSLKRAMRVSGRSDFESGDFRNADVLRLNLARDYKPKAMTREGDNFVLDLIATNDEAAYDAMKLTVRASDNMPLKEELYASSGKLLRILECSEPKDFPSKNGTHRAPSVLKMTNAVAQGRSTEMTIVSLSLEKELPASLFQVESMGR
jgi:outer membrane lipoprotein-sorting protein